MSSDPDQQIWKWKAEPASPIDTSSSLDIDDDDDWLSFESKENHSNEGEQVLYEEEEEEEEEQTSRAQVATKLLEELDEWIKEEPYTNWLEQRTELPFFEDLPPLEYTVGQPIVSAGAAKFHHHETTRTLLQEFESVLGDVEACHQVTPVAALTPPQSPPGSKFYETTNAQILITLQPSFRTLGDPLAKPARPASLEQTSPATVAEPILQWGAENVSLEPLGDVASELAAVDEIVRSCVKDIPPASPACTSSEASSVSSEDANDDPEWTPVAEAANAPKSEVAAKSRYRKPPYSRPSADDRKVRKKEQNKNAATRYRQKKKQEVKEIVGEEQELTNYNESLRSQVGDLQREIRYLKGLMRDLFKAQGLLK